MGGDRSKDSFRLLIFSCVSSRDSFRNAAFSAASFCCSACCTP